MTVPEKQEVVVRTKDGMTYGYKNVKTFTVTAHDYRIDHDDGSMRLINRMDVVDIVVTHESVAKYLDDSTPAGHA